jgi:hypothetical protein
MSLQRRIDLIFRGSVGDTFNVVYDRFEDEHEYANH